MQTALALVQQQQKNNEMKLSYICVIPQLGMVVLVEHVMVA